MHKKPSLSILGTSVTYCNLLTGLSTEELSQVGVVYMIYIIGGRLAARFETSLVQPNFSSKEVFISPPETNSEDASSSN